MKLDFFARRAHYIDHLAPVWLALPADVRGTFYVAPELAEHAQRQIGDEGLQAFPGDTPPGTGPILTAAYADMYRAARTPRPLVSMEHGTGHAFGRSPYPNGRGKRDLVDLFLMPNEYTAGLSRSVRSTPCEVIGTPKMDAFAPDRFPARKSPGDPVIAIAFHWGERNANPPESGTAWEHYRDFLPQLAKRYKVLGHGHPLSAHIYRHEFERIGVEWVGDFRDILRRADIYLNDLSSTMYEFVVTGKPVVVLNAPWFRRGVHWGIRFWDYADVGIQVEGPERLIDAIETTLAHYETVHLAERRQAVEDLYPYLGRSAARAVSVLTSFLEAA
jgi:hypothetical protein